MLGMDVLRRGISERLVFVVDAGGSRDGGGGKLGHLARPLWGQGEGVVEGTKCHCWRWKASDGTRKIDSVGRTEMGDGLKQGRRLLVFEAGEEEKGEGGQNFEILVWSNG